MNTSHQKFNILITGAGEEIGKALVRKLIAKGHLVWAVARSEDHLIQLRDAVASPSFSYSVMTDGEVGVRAAIQDMEKKSFVPHVVILNPAAYAEDLNPRYNPVLVKKNFDVNFFDSLLWVDAFLPTFEQKGGCQFIGISSISAFLPDQNSIGYSGSKAALRMAFRSLRLRYSRTAFKLVHFGPVATSLTPYWISPSGAPRYSFVLQPAKAADFIVRIMTRSSGDYFFPFFLTLPLRLLSFMPDRLFAFVSRALKKRPHHEAR